MLAYRVDKTPVKTVRHNENRCTALILTSSSVLRAMIADFLLESEAPIDEILYASNEGEARYFLRNSRIDILIADHTVTWKCEPPVLVIGPPVVEKIQRSLDEGAAGYLVKPFSRESLVREVDYALQPVAA
jgi:response regulator of citrate/malate metabolism